MRDEAQGMRDEAQACQPQVGKPAVGRGQGTRHGVLKKNREMKEFKLYISL